MFLQTRVFPCMAYQIDTAYVVNEYTDFISDTDIMFMAMDCKFI